MTGLFNLPPRSTRAGDASLAKKSRGRTQTSAGIKIKGGGGLLDRISTIQGLVERNLGQYKDRYKVITKEQELKEYIDKCIETGIASIDTETTSLDPITCTLAGFSIFTPGENAVYVPINHVSYITGQRVAKQLKPKQATKELVRLVDKEVKTIWFNAKFDIRVLTNQLGITFKPYWDGYLAARLLNENEKENGLKALHQKYVLKGEGDAFKFNHLFSGIPFTHIPIKTGYIYAARDAEITYELYEFQEPFLTPDNEECISRDLLGPASVYHTIELPLVSVVAKMEDTGVAFDFEYAQELSEKYTKQLEEAEKVFFSEVEKHKEDIEAYRAQQGNNSKLGDPINIASPTQIAILLYDILGVTPPDKNSPRGTGVAILESINNEVTRAILSYREVAKLLTTYIDKMPEIVNSKTKRVHASFNQIGAATGRMSSSNPNMQNIPSRNNDIRKMFKATEGHYMISSDYSAQEPRITAHMSKDEKMIQAYKEGKDLYVEVASIAFNLPYEECKEFREDGSKNPEGHQRREQAKAVVLGVCYSKGVPSIAEDLGITVETAQEIYDKIMTSFPGLLKFMEESEQMARDKGFVDTVWGRKRRLPAMQMPKYEFDFIGEVPANFDPLSMEDQTPQISEAQISKYTRLMDNAYGRSQQNKVRQQAEKEGIEIKNNGGFIAEATRQCVNSRIQGSAADQTKKAMLLVGTDKQLKELGFKMLLPVHDEIIGEVPKENIKEAGKRFQQLMVDAAKDLSVPSKCDLEITERWYGKGLQITI